MTKGKKNYFGKIKITNETILFQLLPLKNLLLVLF